MNFNNFTLKAQEALQKAQELASANRNQEVGNLHILKGIFTVDENVVPYLLKKLNTDISALGQAIDRRVDSLPKVTGGDQYLSAEASKALQKSVSLSKEMKDDFVSIEHLLLGILSVNDDASRVLKDNGVTEHDLTTAIQQLRQGGNVSSPTAE
ncbi:MAG TPA: Clp protease N-terminal domain-containing protein, partial [Bacteroidales bacterium]|nr:Clp protease N-terminal domain-containing protein [Bacteroidales bacterium]